MKILKEWFMRTFCMNRILLGSILIELKNIHYHLDRLDDFYRLVNKIEIKEKEIIEDKKIKGK